MKILLISDFGIQHNIGGAQRSNQIIIDKGRARNHEIDIYHYDTKYIDESKQYDFVISSNLEVIYAYNKPLISWIISQPNHVRLEHDMCRYMLPEHRQWLYQSCKKTFFLTNHHYNKFKENYGDYFINVEIVPDPIDKNTFYDMKLDRQDYILYTGFMHQLKGTDNFIDFVLDNPEQIFVVAGWGDQKYEDFMRQQNNVLFCGKIDHQSMPILLNSYKKMYYRPVIDEPFCRSVGEAIMCGMEIIGNSDKIGSLNSFREDHVNFANNCHHAAYRFWEILENENIRPD